MQILLSQSEIEIAVRQYVMTLGVSRPVEVITFVTTRNPTTITAEIQMDQVGATGTGGVSGNTTTQASQAREADTATEPEPTTQEETAPRKASTRGSSAALFKKDNPAANETTQVATEAEPTVAEVFGEEEVEPTPVVPRKKLFG